MKNVKYYLLGLSFVALNLGATLCNGPDAYDRPRGRVSTFCHHCGDKLSDCYAHSYDKLRNHKGKVGLAVGAVGATIINKVLEKEIEVYVKPFFKSIGARAYNFIKRIFRR